MHDDEIVSMVLSVPTLWRAFCLSHPFNLKGMGLGTTAELLAISARLSPGTPQRKLVSAAGFHTLILSVTAHSLLTQVRVRK